MWVTFASANHFYLNVFNLIMLFKYYYIEMIALNALKQFNFIAEYFKFYSFLTKQPSGLRRWHPHCEASHRKRENERATEQPRGEHFLFVCFFSFFGSFDSFLHAHIFRCTTFYSKWIRSQKNVPSNNVLQRYTSPVNKSSTTSSTTTKTIRERTEFVCDEKVAFNLATEKKRATWKWIWLWIRCARH